MGALSVAFAFLTDEQSIGHLPQDSCRVPLPVWRSQFVRFCIIKCILRATLAIKSG